MTQRPDQFCGICGKQRAAGMSVCPNCGSPYERPESGSQSSMQFTPAEGMPKPTNVLWGGGVAPPPMQYSGMFPQTPATPLPGTPPRKEKSSPWVKLAIAQGAVIIVLLIVLVTVLLVRQPQSAGNSSGPGVASAATATSVALATSTSAPTATATPAPSLPCNVDVGTWASGSADWKPFNGVLMNDGSGGDGGPSPSIVAPCQLGNTANYAVEAKMQAGDKTRNDYGSCFGISVRGSTPSSGWQGYGVSIGNCSQQCCQGGQPVSGASIFGPKVNSVSTSNFQPGTDVYTYRVEVNSNMIKFFINGGLFLTLTDYQYLSGSQVGLWCSGVSLQVFSFQVTGL